MNYQTITARGQTVDSGVVQKTPDTNRVIGTVGQPGPGTETGPAKPSPKPRR
jgi:hypothetical protein